MKLRNKKTGVIKECVVIPIDSNGYPNEYQVFEKGESLAELNEEWEDAPEEPKGNWYINEFGTPIKAAFVGRETLYDKCRKNFGNYFESKEEAEKAVEKLKAWKRLKDKGFRFLPEASFIQQKNDEGESIGSISFTMDDEDDYIWGNNKDLDLLFGGEECVIMTIK